VQLDFDPGRKMFAGLAEQDVTAGHQIEPGVAFEKEAGGIGQQRLFAEGRDVGGVKQRAKLSRFLG